MPFRGAAFESGATFSPCQNCLASVLWLEHLQAFTAAQLRHQTHATYTSTDTLTVHLPTSMVSSIDKMSMTAAVGSAQSLQHEASHWRPTVLIEEVYRS
jgi:hypothetical protein